MPRPHLPRSLLPPVPLKDAVNNVRAVKYIGYTNGAANLTMACMSSAKWANPQDYFEDHAKMQADHMRKWSKKCRCLPDQKNLDPRGKPNSRAFLLRNMCWPHPMVLRRRTQSLATTAMPVIWPGAARQSQTRLPQRHNLEIYGPKVRLGRTSLA